MFHFAHDAAWGREVAFCGTYNFIPQRSHTCLFWVILYENPEKEALRTVWLSMCKGTKQVGQFNLNQKVRVGR